MVLQSIFVNTLCLFAQLAEREPRFLYPRHGPYTGLSDDCLLSCVDTTTMLEATDLSFILSFLVYISLIT